MDEIMLEIGILKKILQENRDTHNEELGEESVTYGTVFYSLLNYITKQELLSLSDKDMVRYIQKIQLIESDK